jgi:DNA-binding MarR family transcriptional regulator
MHAGIDRFDRLASSGSRVSEVGFEASVQDAPPPMRALAIAVRDLSIALRAMRERFADRLDLSAHEYSALMMVSQWGVVTPKELAAELNITPGAVTTLLDRLTRLEFVTRQPNPEDRRSLHIALGYKALAVKHDAYRDYFNAISRAACANPSLTSPELIRALDTLTSEIGEGA